MSSLSSLVDKNLEEAALIPLNLGRPLFEEMIVLRGPNSFNISNSAVASGGIGGKNWVRVEYDSSKGNWWIQEMVVIKETLVAKNSNGHQIWIPLKNRQQICLFGSYNFVFVQNLQETLCGMPSRPSMGQLSQQKQEGQVYSKTLAQLEEELTCSICMEIFTNPVLYRCGHVFCGGCIAEWNLRCTEQIVLCPLCHQELNLPIDELKFYTIMLQNIIPLVKQLVEQDKEMVKLSTISQEKPIIPVTAQEVPNFAQTCPASIAIPSTSNVPASRSAGKVRIIFNQSDRQSTQQSNNQIEVIDIDDDDNTSSNSNNSTSGPDDDEIIWLDDPTVVAQHWQQLRRQCPHHRRTTTATGMH